MREFIWVHPLSGTEFGSKSEYLDFMRTRYRKRVAQDKMKRFHNRLINELLQVRDIISFDEMNDFLRDNLWKFSKLTNLDFKHIEVKMNQDRDDRWSGNILVGYYPRHMAGTVRSYDHYDNILKKMGIRTGGGGGFTHNMRLSVTIEKSDFPHLATYEALR